MNDLVELFCELDDFCRDFEPSWPQKFLEEKGSSKRQRAGRLSLSELMTLVVSFHRSSYRHFKAFYTQYVCVHWREEFPGLVSYNRFVELMPRALAGLCGYLQSHPGQKTGLAFVDSTALAVCQNARINRHRVFKSIAQRGKTSMGWFYGFKLHLIINDQGELLAVQLTSGKTDDRKPVRHLAQGLSGKLFGDKGYISQSLFDDLFEQGVKLVTKVRSNMRNRLVALFDKLLLRKRPLIEAVIDQLKNITQIEHTRHRSVSNFLVNLVSGLVAYSLQPSKPSLDLTPQDKTLLALY
jgi:hypothetical protein